VETAISGAQMEHCVSWRRIDATVRSTVQTDPMRQTVVNNCHFYITLVRSNFQQCEEGLSSLDDRHRFDQTVRTSGHCLRHLLINEMTNLSLVDFVQ